MIFSMLAFLSFCHLEGQKYSWFGFSIPKLGKNDTNRIMFLSQIAMKIWFFSIFDVGRFCFFPFRGSNTHNFQKVYSWFGFSIPILGKNDTKIILSIFDVGHFVFRHLEGQKVKIFKSIQLIRIQHTQIRLKPLYT